MQYKLNPRLVVDTVPEELETVSKLLTMNEPLNIDLSNITYVDSSGVALLIEIKNRARSRNINLSFSNVTGEIERLCKLYQIKI